MSLISIIKKKTRNTLFTTPSHSGKYCIVHKFYQWYRSDISETDTHSPQEVLAKAEKRAAEIYGTKYTKFLINGSSSGIIAAIIASGAKKVLIWDKAHQCHKNGCKLAGAEIIEYQLPFDDNLGVYRAIQTTKMDKLLQQYAPDAIVVTSPTYEGFAVNIKEAALICKKYNVCLIVDEAHGAIYPFSDKLPLSAVKYADFTVQSLHKTAGGLNPTALLHSNNIDPAEALNMITTTSPSYPLLASIEANINYLASNKGKKRIEELILKIRDLDLPQHNDDITKILIKKDGLSGFELSDILFNKYRIEDERTNEKSTMLLCGIGTDDAKLKYLKKVLRNLGF